MSSALSTSRCCRCEDEGRRKSQYNQWVYIGRSGKGKCHVERISFQIGQGRLSWLSMRDLPARVWEDKQQQRNTTRRRQNFSPMLREICSGPLLKNAVRSPLPGRSDLQEYWTTRLSKASSPGILLLPRERRSCHLSGVRRDRDENRGPHKTIEQSGGPRRVPADAETGQARGFDDGWKSRLTVPALSHPTSSGLFGPFRGGPE
jgi:hypothetical protein